MHCATCCLVPICIYIYILHIKCFVSMPVTGRGYCSLDTIKVAKASSVAHRLCFPSSTRVEMLKLIFPFTSATPSPHHMDSSPNVRRISSYGVIRRAAELRNSAKKFADLSCGHNMAIKMTYAVAPSSLLRCQTQVEA